MPGRFRFRYLLTAAGTSVSIAFGAVGFWERNHIVSRPFLNSNLWESTARLHVWPWPFKLAGICDMPAFIGGTLLMLPIRLVCTTLPEFADLVPAGVLTVILWYCVACRLERYSLATRSLLLICFGLLSLTGALVPIGHTGWLPFGFLMWCIAVLSLRFVSELPVKFGQKSVTQGKFDRDLRTT